MIFYIIGILLSFAVGYIVRSFIPTANAATAMKLAKIQAISDNAKNIEAFVVKWIDELDDETIEVLIARIEMLKADSVINADTILKNRIEDDFAKKRVAEEEIVDSLAELFQPEQKTRKKRNVKKSG